MCHPVENFAQLFNVFSHPLMDFALPFSILSYPFLDFDQPFNHLGYPFKLLWRSLNISPNRLPSIYNPFIFTV